MFENQAELLYFNASSNGIHSASAEDFRLVSVKSKSSQSQASLSTPALHPSYHSTSTLRPYSRKAFHKPKRPPGRDVKRENVNLRCIIETLR
jgi:hypothetical protein